MAYQPKYPTTSEVALRLLAVQGLSRVQIAQAIGRPVKSVDLLCTCLGIRTHARRGKPRKQASPVQAGQEASKALPDIFGRRNVCV